MGYLPIPNSKIFKFVAIFPKYSNMLQNSILFILASSSALFYIFIYFIYNENVQSLFTRLLQYLVGPFYRHNRSSINMALTLLHSIPSPGIFFILLIFLIFLNFYCLSQV